MPDQLTKFQQEVDRLIDKTVDRLIQVSQRHPDTGVFSLSHTSIKNEVRIILEEFHDNLYDYIRTRVYQRWTNAEMLMKDALTKVVEKAGLSTEEWNKTFRFDHLAFQAFLDRRYNNTKLSDRVWSITRDLRWQFEYTVDTAIRNGVGAKEWAKDVKKYLKEPDKLFRRVRGEDGVLRLSKAAKAYKPGQGVYRSSYQNAFRLARTETNMAFHRATYEKAQQLDFIVGIRIVTSHDKRTCDICDALAGDYPKDFIFSGFHPACRCSQIMILKTDAEFAAGSVGSSNTVRDVPAAFKKYMREHPSYAEKSFIGIDNKKYL